MLNDLHLRVHKCKVLHNCVFEPVLSLKKMFADAPTRGVRFSGRKTVFPTKDEAIKRFCNVLQTEKRPQKEIPRRAHRARPHLSLDNLSYRARRALRAHRRARIPRFLRDEAIRGVRVASSPRKNKAQILTHFTRKIITPYGQKV